MRYKRGLALIMGGLLVAGSSHAMAIYAYTGTPYSTGIIIDNPTPSGTFVGSQQLTGSITLSSALAPDLVDVDISGLVTSFSFSHGRGSMSEAGDLLSISVSTDGSGDVIGWDFDIQDDTSGQGFTHSLGEQWNEAQSTSTTGYWGTGDQVALFQCTSFASGFCNTAFGDGARNNDVGSWTTQFVPEPSTALLLATGLAGLAARRRRLH